MELDVSAEGNPDSPRVTFAARAADAKAFGFDHDVIEAHKVPVTIRWVTNQNTRWGSCTPADGAIRISHRLAGMPDYVIDCVVMHEIAQRGEPPRSFAVE